MPNKAASSYFRGVPPLLQREFEALFMLFRVSSKHFSYPNGARNGLILLNTTISVVMSQKNFFRQGSQNSDYACRIIWHIHKASQVLRLFGAIGFSGRSGGEELVWRDFQK
jgi:hypothetical protein